MDELLELFIGGCLTGLMLSALVGVIYLIKFLFALLKSRILSSEEKELKKKLISEGYSADQIQEILKGKRNKIAFEKYMDKSFHTSQMEQLRIGLEHGIDIEPYLDKEYTSSQMLEIRLGIEGGIDILPLLNSQFTAEMMKSIRLELMSPSQPENNDTKTELKKYTSKDLNWGVRVILIIAIVLGVVYSIKNPIKHIPTMGYFFPTVEFLGGVASIAANVLMLSVSLIGFYLFVGIRIVILIIVCCIDIESGISTLFVDMLTIGFVYCVLKLKKNGVSAWEMMVSNHKIWRANKSLPKEIVAEAEPLSVKPEIKHSEVEVRVAKVAMPVDEAPIPQVEEPVSVNKIEESTTVSSEKPDRYTRLYQAISPANFLDPYSPEKVKLANELLEALIKNKENEVVISLIEEKANADLGVSLSDE